jgi:hypothetical protein
MQVTVMHPFKLAYYLRHPIGIVGYIRNHERTAVKGFPPAMQTSLTPGVLQTFLHGFPGYPPAFILQLVDGFKYCEKVSGLVKPG